MTGLSLTQEQRLQQKLSPSQIQVVKLLELPSCELGQRINEELQDNPALEEGLDAAPLEEEMNENVEGEFVNPLQNEDFDYNQYIQDDETPEYCYHDVGGGEEENKDIPFSIGVSFGEYLKSQIYLTKMSKPQRHIAKFVVGNIDEDGYLRRTAEELCDDLMFREGLTVDTNEMEDIIRQIKQFDPPGVGAANLKECLLIQLEQKPQTDAIGKAKRILSVAFDDFSHRRYDRLADKVEYSDQELKEAIAEITKLCPKPGNAWNGTVYDRNQTTIIPDFFVENQDNELVVTLNTGDIPELHVSQEYANMLKDYNNEKNQTRQMRDAVRFVKNKLDSARWFIDAIKQRNETLIKTMRAIVQIQKEWFYEGDETNLKPMVLQDIANLTGYDASTISRVSNSKYVQTEFGIFSLKFFFSEGITNKEGEQISTREVKKMLKELVEQEDKHNPLQDDELVQQLSTKGYNIARRTVAKYREQLGIPVARLRREV